MPRKRKTMSGADAQNISSVPGQRYGEGVEQQALQQAMPAPDNAGEAIQAASAQPVLPPAGRPDPAAITDFLARNKPAMLSGSQRPEVPVTDGLSSGPGVGPEALRSQTPMSRYLLRLAEETGNPKWRRIAERAGMS